MGSGFKFDPYIVVACMLVQEGADPLIKNTRGESPLQKCPADVGSVIKMFSQKHRFVTESMLHSDIYIQCTNVGDCLSS